MAESDDRDRQCRVLLTIGCITLMRLFGLDTSTHRAIAHARAAWRTFVDPALNDDYREHALQRHAGALMGLFVTTATAGSCAVLIPLGGIWALDGLGLVRLADILDVMASWWFLGGSGIAAFAVLVLHPRAAA